MAQSITRTYPDAWVTRMIPAVNSFADKVEGHRIIQKILEDRGVTPDADGVYHVDGLTTVQKAELLIDLHMWRMVSTYEREDAVEQAAADAAAALVDAFDGGDAP